jgi:hypothetical protein
MAEEDPIREQSRTLGSLRDRVIARKSTPFIFVLFVLSAWLLRILLLALTCGWDAAWSGECHSTGSGQVVMILSNSLGEVTSVSIATLILGILFIAITGREERRVLVDALPQPRIAPTILRATGGTRSWHYKGGTGTFLKSKTIPALKEAVSKSNAASINITIQILDPRDNKLCKSYADMMLRNKSNSPVKDVNWNESLVRQQCLATILTAVIYQEEEQRLIFDLYLCDHASVFRYDMAEDVLIVTREQPNEPGIRYPRGYFYESHRAELELSKSQSHPLDLRDLRVGRRELDGLKAREVLNAAGISGSFSDEDYRCAAQYATSPTSAFG